MGSLFGTSGIRGTIGAEIGPELFIELGLSLATYLGNQGSVLVGRDPRTSGEMLESSLVAGILAGGCDVRRTGMVPTPALALGVKLSGAKAGAMITASHNPPEYNGVKFWDSEGMAYTPQREGEIERLYFGKGWRSAEWNAVGQCEIFDISEPYFGELRKHVELKGGLKIVVDCGNGAASSFTPVILRELGCKVIGLNCHQDGNFPGRGLEPDEHNLQRLCMTVKTVGADLGVAHDGDADRIGAIDEEGNFVGGDQLLALMAGAQIEGRGGTVVTTVDASRIVDYVVEEAGGRVVRTRVGDVAVAQAVLESGAVFGGEPCGAWIFPRVHLAPDGILSALKLVELLEKTGNKLSELVQRLPEYSTVREKIHCAEERKKRVMEKVFEIAPGALGAREVNKADGLRAELEDGWVLIRPSGTEPCIRITVEAKSKELAGELAEKTSALVRELSKQS